MPAEREVTGLSRAVCLQARLLPPALGTHTVGAAGALVSGAREGCHRGPSQREGQSCVPGALPLPMLLPMGCCKLPGNTFRPPPVLGQVGAGGGALGHTGGRQGTGHDRTSSPEGVGPQAGSLVEGATSEDLGKAPCLASSMPGLRSR